MGCQSSWKTLGWMSDEVSSLSRTYNPKWVAMPKLPDSDNSTPPTSSKQPDSLNGSTNGLPCPYPRNTPPSYAFDPHKLGTRVVTVNGKLTQFPKKRFAGREWQNIIVKILYGFIEEKPDQHHTINDAMLVSASLVPWTQKGKQDEQSSDQKQRQRNFEILGREEEALPSQPAPSNNGNQHPKISGNGTALCSEATRKAKQPIKPRDSRGSKETQKKTRIFQPSIRFSKKDPVGNATKRRLLEARKRKIDFEARARDSVVMMGVLIKNYAQRGRMFKASRMPDIEVFWKVFDHYQEFVRMNGFVKTPGNINQLWHFGIVGDLEMKFFRMGEAQSKEKVF